MYEIIQKAHSGVAYLALTVLVVAVINALLGYTSKKAFTDKDRKIALFALIFCHIQLLLGLILYFVSPMGFDVLGEMSDSLLRKTSLEHPLTNILAIALITVGWSTHKKQQTDQAKFTKIALFYFIGLVLLLAMIPWNLWFN
ncbi:hypothetical protein ABGT15_10175 [Flavobacterium enshiense]|uniref:hypothetical protein n=1 Tax=Flavobacterium enshiense TaxID=1341165 RepID=UPI00345D5782